MKILTWNCNGAFRKKYTLFSEDNIDIMIIQECENPAESIDLNYKNWASNYIWVGDNKNKGLGIFCNKSIEIVNNNWDTENLKYFISVKINKEFDLIAIWNHHANSPNFKYIGQFWKYLQLHKDKMKGSFIIGDFNSNKIWDQWDRWWNHSDVVKELSEIGIRSIYHDLYNESQGSESIFTFYLQKNIAKRYHIDYAFADNSKFKNITKFHISNPDYWLKYSDHMPIFIEY
jgi:exonuclease III